MINRIPYNKRKPMPGVQVNAGSNFAQGLKFCWLFNEQGGLKLNDIAGKYNIGVLTNGPVWNNLALSFDGTDDYVALTYLLSSANAPVTVSAWVKSNSIGANQWIIDDNNDNNLGLGTSMRILTTGKIRFWSQDAIYQTDSNTALTAGLWYHCVGTYDGSNNRVYINGILENTVAVGVQTARNAANPQIGKSAFFGFPFNGYIDDVRIWNRALGPTEVAKLYAQPYSMFLMNNLRFTNSIATTGTGNFFPFF